VTRKSKIITIAAPISAFQLENDDILNSEIAYSLTERTTIIFVGFYVFYFTSNATNIKLVGPRTDVDGPRFRMHKELNYILHIAIMDHLGSHIIYNPSLIDSRHLLRTVGREFIPSQRIKS
jgi:hypothetical protein